MKDLRCFFKNGTLYCSAELYDKLKAGICVEELPLNATTIARTWGVTVEPKSAVVLDKMEADYHEHLHAKAVRDMMLKVGALKRFLPPGLTTEDTHG